MAIERKITSSEVTPGMFFIMKGSNYQTNRWLVLSMVPSEEGMVVTYIGFEPRNGHLKWSSSVIKDDPHSRDFDLARDWYILEP